MHQYVHEYVHAYYDIHGGFSRVSNPPKKHARRSAARGQTIIWTYSKVFTPERRKVITPERHTVLTPAASRRLLASVAQDLN